MAPEQAAGGTTKVSKATDVYGLGAVLYQLLTGHPPFAGGTTYETIKLLLETEPRQPRLVNRKIDSDLSTICLKCLEKDPQRRYSSALALAEDFEHWLKHEPIQARRSGIIVRGRKWVQRNPTSALLAASLIALAAAAAWIVWKNGFIPEKVGTTNGVAVLPFENLSPDPDNAYFADGLQEEILTRLAKIAGLKVISRTSTQHYQSKPRNLGEIARQLGVASILEGGVQKTADQVRVSVQFINAQTDSHLWADTYDRKLTDVFGVESEIARRIAQSLQAKLTGREEQALAVKPTNNPEAYEAYLRGLAFEARGYSGISAGLEAKAAGFYERAVELDPNFALAWARLSRANAYICANPHDSTIAPCDEAKRALENAQRLEPNSPETMLALGYYQSRVLGDSGAVETTFKRVSKMLPGNSEVLMALGRVTRGQARSTQSNTTADRRWDETIAYFEQALALDPRDVELLMDAALTYADVRQFPAALKLYDRALDITPNDPDVIAAEAWIYQAQGNLQEAARLLSGIDWQTPSGNAFVTKVAQLEFERNYGEAIRLLQARLTQYDFPFQLENAEHQMRLAFAQHLANDIAGGKVTAQQARDTYEQLHKDQPKELTFTMGLCFAYALMGEKNSALKLAEREIKYPKAGSTYQDFLAMVQTICGENSQAISTLTQQLQTRYFGNWYGTPITPALLRLDPIWDPLRADPAFQKLCEQKPK
jgi:TolB-like protein/cytochrome c-type biogenesis protein CcmH/NrfG